MSATFTASSILAQNGYTTTDFSAENVEYWIDDSIDTVNDLAVQSIDAMAGIAGSKTATCTRTQAPAVKTLITIILREAKKTSLSNSNSTSSSNSTSKSVSLGPASYSEGGSVGAAISAASALNNASDSPLVELFYRLIDSLKTNTASASNIAFCVGTDTS
jgi:hypothetical protein